MKAKSIGTKPPINIGAFKTGKLVYTDDGQVVTSWVTLHMPRFYHDECLVLPRSTFKYKEGGETNGGKLGEFVTSSKFDFHSWDRWEVAAGEA